MVAVPAGLSPALLRAQAPSVNTAALGDGPYARLQMLLERTIFRVDVLTLEVRLGPDAAARLEALLESSDRRLDPDALRDSVAAIVLGARNALTRLEFERDVGLDHFLDGICLLYTSPSPRDRTRSRMPSSA